MLAKQQKVLLAFAAVLFIFLFCFSDLQKAYHLHQKILSLASYDDSYEIEDLSEETSWSFSKIFNISLPKLHLSSSNNGNYPDLDTPPFASLSSLCQETEWTPGLWLHCHSGCGENGTSICGGLNNAHTRILTCIRLAIDAGAGWIIPSATTRNPQSLRDTNHITLCPDTFWNIGQLQDVLAHACPQLEVRNCDDTSGISRFVEVSPKIPDTEAYSAGTFREAVHETIASSEFQLGHITESKPVAVTFKDAFNAWNYSHSGEMKTIRRALFQSVKFNQTLLDLGNEIVDSLREEPSGFVAVHLRGEDDWVQNWGSRDDQINKYLEEIDAYKKKVMPDLKVIYVSCGDQGAIQTFRALARLAPRGFKVVDKWTALQGNRGHIQEIDDLGFDEKAVVEYPALMAADLFIGISTSSMSDMIALARTVDEEEEFLETYIFPGSWKSDPIHRDYGADSGKVKGSARTKLLVNSGPCILDSFR